jgi:V8-like Glu-specific endopeptidase
VQTPANHKENRSRFFAYSRRGLLVLLFVAATFFNGFAQQPDKPARPESQIIEVPDRRVMVADTRQFPFSAVVKLRVTFPDGTKAEGSGALIGSDQVLTADHVVFDESLGGDATSVEVLPGYANNYTSCRRTFAKSWRHSSHHGCHDGAKCDVAILTLRESLGCNTGWFGFKQYDDDDLKEVFIAGYPADLDDGQKMYFEKTHASIVSDEYHNILTYRDWTYSGMSGSPIFTSDYYIIGVHTNGSSNANYGIAFCNKLFAQLKDWAGR